jgi:hypothetical protein
MKMFGRKIPIGPSEKRQDECRGSVPFGRKTFDRLPAGCLIGGTAMALSFCGKCLNDITIGQMFVY